MRRKLSENIRHVEERIAEACRQARRPRSDVTLVAVTKSVGPDVIRTLLELGHCELGESRVQELTRRAAMIHEWEERRARDPALVLPAPRWHMVGHLQRNKVRTLMPWVSMIHSVDSLRLAEEINKESGRLQRITPVLIEINASGESNKHGIAVAATTHLAGELNLLANVRVRGLMTMAPLTDDVVRVRRVFERVRELFEEIVSERLCGPEFRCLSMGMSGDFEQAILEGATHVRIGTALFEGIETVASPVGEEEFGAA
jgi:hypothetical protein